MISVGQWARIPGFHLISSHSKHSKMLLDASLFNFMHYNVRIKSKWSNQWKGVAPSPTPRCNSY